MHAAWKIATGKDQFLSSILKAKYYPNTSFWLAKQTPTKSPFWSSILEIKECLTQNCTVQIHKGNSSIWSTPWCDIWKTIHDHLNLPTTRMPLPQTIEELKNPRTHTWNTDPITNIFNNEASQIITNTHIVPSDQSDIIRWKPSTKGACTSKDAFRHLNALLQDQIPRNGARGITDQVIAILQKLWKHKQISPCIKTFSWRMIRRALATGVRAGRFTDKIKKECTAA